MAETEKEVLIKPIKFDTDCPNCYSKCDTNVTESKIPYFKSVLIMATSCDYCGWRTNEVKSETTVSEKGIKYTLKLTDLSDLSREVLKSSIAFMEIPEIDFSLESGTLGGKLTTLEGILRNCYDQLSSFCPFTDDSLSINEDKRKMKIFLDKLKSIYSGQMLDVTIIIDDPSGNSYLQNLYAPEPDPNLTVEYYERNFDQNDLLGLNEIKID